MGRPKLKQNAPAKSDDVFKRACRLFVVAAHPDDDAIGCGGTIATIAARGGAVHVAYLTDGGASHPGSRRFSRHAVATMREAEARAALVELGVDSAPDFYALPDSGLGALDAGRKAATIARLGSSVRAFAPDVLLMPWIRDPHSDHIAASEIARSAALWARSDAALASYDVWLSIRGSAPDRPRAGETTTVTVPLDANAVAAKRRALFAHRSQTSDLIDDDPAGFRITADLAERWLGPSERFFLLSAGTIASC